MYNSRFSSGFSSRFTNSDFESGMKRPSFMEKHHYTPRAQFSSISKPEVLPGGDRGYSKSQVYEELKQENLSNGTLFEDPNFPADDRSLFYSKAPPRPFEWKRPHEICSDPELFVGGASRFDVKQGELGDCWLLAAVASLSLHQDLLFRVVPRDQSFSDNYAGIFHFQFWQFGEWIDVVVDDRLPTYYGRLVFMHSAENNEFWTPLLEKAYAKLCGSYEALKGGSQSEAMEDFTGGVTENFEFCARAGKYAPENLFKIMQKANAKSSLMGCSIEANPNVTEAILDNGLVMGHAYSITGVNVIDNYDGNEVKLVRVRNPWGNEQEWNGAWSDSSHEWKYIDESQRQKVGLVYDDDGEFWMSFEDFVNNFERVEICNLGPDSIEDSEDSKGKRRWEMSLHHAQWMRNTTAGGCRNFPETFHTNPQFFVEVTDPDDDDDEDMGTLIVGLMQEGARKKRNEGGDCLTIGYAIYKTPDGHDGSNLPNRYFLTNRSTATSKFINLREVCTRHKLKPDKYVVVCSAFKPNQESEFILRLFSEKENKAGRMDTETGYSPVKNNVHKEDEDDAAKAQRQALKDAFEHIAGSDEEIDAYELRHVLNAAFEREGFKFSDEASRSLVAIMDYDHSGKLGFEEFNALWSDLKIWKSAFKKYDADHSGTFNAHELRPCLKSIGFSLSNQTFSACVVRYARKDGSITFDDYILLVARLKTIFDTYRAVAHGSETANFTMEEYIKSCIYT